MEWNGMEWNGLFMDNGIIPIQVPDKYFSKQYSKITELNKMLIVFYFRTFIRIRWCTVSPAFRYTVREDEFDYSVFSKEYIRHDTTFYALDIDKHFIFYFILTALRIGIFVRLYEESA
jgi:hypothetical protein